MTPKITASVMCANQLELGQDIQALEQAGIDMLHVDVMDGTFVPNITIGVQTCRAMRAATALPFDYHLLVQNPNWLVDDLPISGGDYLSVHVESGCDLKLASDSVHARGGLFGITFNPSTPIDKALRWIGVFDFINLMMIEPGFAGRPMVDGAMDRIISMRSLLDSRNLKEIPIEVDGNVSFTHAPEMRRRGADFFVAGTSSVFARGMSIAEGTRKLREAINDADYE